MTEKAASWRRVLSGVEATLRELAGVKDMAVGYEGGHTENSNYKDVCADRTGHA